MEMESWACYRARTSCTTWVYCRPSAPELLRRPRQHSLNTRRRVMYAPTRRSHWGLIVLLIIAVLLVGGFWRVRIGRLPGEVYGAPKVALNVAGSSPPLSLADFKNGFASVIDP